MRIVYLHQYFCTRTMPGGTRSYEVARRLVAAGHEVHMITSRRDPPPGAPSRWTVTDEDGIRVHWFPVPYANRMGYPARIAAFVRFAWVSARRAAAIGGDVVLASSTPLTIALPGVWAALRRRIPFVLEVRDLWPEVPIAMGALRDPVSIAAASWLERFAYRHASRVIALSPGMRDGVVAAGYAADRVTVIPNASDIDLFDIPPDRGVTLRRETAWLGDRPLVAYTGTLGPLNGVRYLVRVAAAALQLDPDVRFVAIGEGKEEPLVREEAERLGVLNRNFFLLPIQPKAAIPVWLSATDLAVSTVIDRQALWANSANKVFDAFAAGRPVAVNHEGWLADLLRESGAGLVLPARDPAAGAAAVVRAVRDPQWRARSREAARRLAHERFDRDLLARQFANVLAAAVGDPRPATLARAAHAA